MGSTSHKWGRTQALSLVKDIGTYQNISGNDLWVVTDRLHKEHLLETQWLRRPV